MKSTLILALASVAIAMPAVQKAKNIEDFNSHLSDAKKGNKDVYDAFQKADVLNLLDDGIVSRRQVVPLDATPNPNRNHTIPDNVFVLQCTDPGFRAECLVFGAAPGKCGMFFTPTLEQ